MADTYDRTIVRAGDIFSDQVASEFAETLNNPRHNGRHLMDVLQPGRNGLAVVRVPTGFLGVTHSTDGNPAHRDPYDHARSLVQRLAAQASYIGAQPVGFCDIIDSCDLTNGELLARVKAGLKDGANETLTAIFNGESAGLGARVNEEYFANVCASMISIIPKGRLTPGLHRIEGVNYMVFDPEEMAVWMNGDGSGTLAEFYEREFLLGIVPSVEKGLRDAGAMVFDDSARRAAGVRHAWMMVETNGEFPMERIMAYGKALSAELGIELIVQEHKLGERIRSYKPGVPAINYNANSVSTIDEARLRNQPRPQAGNILIGVWPQQDDRRCNGITDTRTGAVIIGGLEWHETEPELREYLGRSGHIYQPVFMRLFREGAAKAAYHASGGAKRGKLAEPLYKEELFVEIDGSKLPPPHPQQVRIAQAIGAKPEEVHAKWPYGVQAYIATDNPERTERILEEAGLNFARFGVLEPPRSEFDRTTQQMRLLTGVRLKGIKDSKGQDIYYDGKPRA
jgi:phosphoribosylaminoimidazole (AIR) synthetase